MHFVCPIGENKTLSVGDKSDEETPVEEAAEEAIVEETTVEEAAE